jgi:predicted dehydrogenase
MRLGYIGSGPISNFHIPALKKVGLKVSLFYSRNFNKAYNFSKVNKIIPPEKSFTDFLNKSEVVDAFVLSIKTDVTAKYLEKLCKLNKPIFVEKPGSLNSKDLKKIKKKTNSKIYFLYNRRFYYSILEGKKFIDSSKKCFVSAKIPDTVKTTHQFVTNGCHIIDILFFYFSELSVVNSYKLKNNIGYYFLLKSKKNDMISCLLNWGSPQNFEINICNEKNAISFKRQRNNYFPIRVYVK